MELKGKKIILGSASPGRKELLKKWVSDFEVVTADIDEKTIRKQNPEDLTIALARAKSKAILPFIKQSALLITLDTVMSQGRGIIEKPCNLREARSFLKNYSNDSVRAFTGVVVVDSNSGERREGVDSTEVRFFELPESVIEELTRKEETYKRAGGYTTKEPLLRPYIKEIKGEEETVIGLPKALTEQLINKIK